MPEPTEHKDVPYEVHKETVEREERHSRRLIYTIILILILLVGTNATWIYAVAWFLNQYEFVSESTVTVDGKEGTANYIGGSGDISNGYIPKNRGEN
jgi:predicted metal-dependent hydrolase